MPPARRIITITSAAGWYAVIDTDFLGRGAEEHGYRYAPLAYWGLVRERGAAEEQGIGYVVDDTLGCVPAPDVAGFVRYHFGPGGL